MSRDEIDKADKHRVIVVVSAERVTDTNRLNWRH
jgi:hypothetical protein